MKDIYVKVDGIHCEHCESKIKKELLKNSKIVNVEIKKNIAFIKYKGNLTKKEIINSITSIDYITKEDYISDTLEDIDINIKLKEFIIILLCILFIVFSIRQLLGFNIFNIIPTIDSSITYGMLVITGFLTSIHCISMCGAINLLAVINSDNKKSMKRPFFYNLGRVLSYTIIGGIAGLIGSVLTINNTITGIMILLASIIMFLMALNMLGIVKFNLPVLKKIPSKSRNPFIIGLLNGLMPCGPLQAMQVYALATGSFITGALSMFLFGIGTVPLMLFVGVIFGVLKGKWKILLNKIAAILILLLSLVMFNRALLSFNLDFDKTFKDYGNFTKSEIMDNYQTVEFDLNYSNYKDIILQKGIPTKIIIHVDKSHLTGCNNEIVMNDFNISKKLEVGDNIIEFTPTEEGTYTYTCWMNMIKNNIKVIDDPSYFKNK